MARESREQSYILYWIKRLRAGAGSAVSSVFGRIGDVTAQDGDYTAGQVTNTSAVAGASVAAALNTLGSAILNTGSDDVDNESGVTGATVSDALDELATNVTNLGNSISTLGSDDIANDSGVTGATVSDALDALEAEIGATTISRERAIRISRLPGTAAGHYKFNATSHIQDNLTTYEYGGVWYQIATWVDFDLKPRIAKRTLPDGAWSAAVDLSTVSGNPLGTWEEDDHNTINVAVDADGRVHVAANHHDDALNYIRSTNPNDITAWTAPGMTGSNENSVTYPQFVKCRNGTLLLFYRNGASGDGNVYLNRYSTTTDTWSALHHEFLDGLSSGENPYLWHIAVDANDRIHIAWCYREDSADRDTNNDLCYAYSDDYGSTWKKTDGTSQTVPITHANADIIVNTADTGSGLLNQGGMEVDSQGRPHIAIFWNVSSVTQIHHVWLDAGTWQVDQISHFDVGTTETNRAITRPNVFVTPADRVYFYYTTKFNRRKGSLRCIDVTPGVTAYQEFRMLDIDFHEAEVMFDTQALYERGELHILGLPAVNGPKPDEYSGNCWRYQIGLVYTFDLDLFDRVQAGMVVLPRIEIVASGTYGDAITFNSTSTAGTNAKVAVPAGVIEQGLVYVRHRARAYQASGTGYLSIRIREEDEESATTSTYGELLFNDSTRRNLETSWMPLRDLPDLAYTTYGLTGYFTGQGVMSAGASTGVMNIHEIQIGVLRLDGFTTTNFS